MGLGSRSRNDSRPPFSWKTDGIPLAFNVIFFGTITAIGGVYFGKTGFENCKFSEGSIPIFLLAAGLGNLVLLGLSFYYRKLALFRCIFNLFVILPLGLIILLRNFPFWEANHAPKNPAYCHIVPFLTASVLVVVLAAATLILVVVACALCCCLGTFPAFCLCCFGCIIGFIDEDLISKMVLWNKEVEAPKKEAEPVMWDVHVENYLQDSENEMEVFEREANILDSPF